MMSDVDEVIWTGNKTLTTSDHLRVVPSRDYYGAVRVEFDYSAPNSTDRNLTMFRLEDENGVEVDGDHPRVSEVGWSRTSAAGSGFFSYTYSHTPYKHLTLPEGMKIIEIMFYPWDSSNGEITVRSLKVSGTAAIEPDKIHYGNSAIKEVYQGSNLVWSASDDFYIYVDGPIPLNSASTKVAEFTMKDFGFIDLLSATDTSIDTNWGAPLPQWNLYNKTTGTPVNIDFPESNPQLAGRMVYLPGGEYELGVSRQTSEVGLTWLSVSYSSDPLTKTISADADTPYGDGTVAELATITPPTSGPYLLLVEINNATEGRDFGTWEERQPRLRIGGEEVRRLHNGYNMAGKVISGTTSVDMIGKHWSTNYALHFTGTIYYYPIT